MQQRLKLGLRIVRSAAAIGVVAYILIVGLCYVIPYYPLSSKVYFQSAVRMQMTVEDWQRIHSNRQSMFLVLGSSVSEHGVNEHTLDTIFTNHSLSLRACNSSSSGMFAKANAAHLRTLLASGVRPERVVYGFFIQDLNGSSVIHDGILDSESIQHGIRQKTLLNVLQYGPKALSAVLDPVTVHIYFNTVNKGFREYDHLSFFQRLMKGTMEVEIGTHYRYDPKLLDDIRDLAELCRNNHIPFALFNTPLRPTITSANDLPYEHRAESYERMAEFAAKNNIPIWNFDVEGLFQDSDFEDTYHLNATGAKRLSQYLGEQVLQWK